MGSPPAAGLPGRQLCVVRGSREHTAAVAARWVAGVSAAQLLWVSDADGAERCAPLALRRQLGGSYLAVVLDLHRRLDVDLLAMAAGFVWGGGALIVRVPHAWPPDPQLVVPPWPVEAVGARMARRVLEALLRWGGAEAPTLPEVPPAVGATRAQDAVVKRLRATLLNGEVAVLTAPRGRGKSAALGRALAAADVAEARVWPSEAGQVGRFAPTTSLVPLERGARGLGPVVVDEAAQLAPPTLRAIVAAAGDAPVLLATTTEGYEGTGQGFSRHFLPWLRARCGSRLAELHLEAPIRFPSGDAVDVFLAKALLQRLPSASVPLGASTTVGLRRLSQDSLASDDALLTQVVRLLLDAHYRTTPSDVHRWLDAPNLDVWAWMRGDQVLAVNVVAKEGSLDAEGCARIAAGVRPRGQVLADTLIQHSLWPEAGALELRRSVRIAVRPDHQGRGVGGQLVAAVLEADPAPLWGTVFAASPRVLRFRRRLGFRLVRVGASLGLRSGLPSVVMLRAADPALDARVTRLRLSLARDLPHQLRWLAADAPELDLRELRAALAVGLGEPTPWPETERDARIDAYARGALHLEAAGSAILDRFGPVLRSSPALGAQLLERRLLGASSWQALGRGVGGVRVAQRLARAALRGLLEV